MSGNRRIRTIAIDCAKCWLRQPSSPASELQSGLKVVRKARTGARVVPPGMQICSEGEPSTEAFTLVDGWAFRYKLLHDGRRQVLGFCLPGDFFGLGYEGSHGYDHSIESITNVVLCVFDKGQFLAAMQSDPALAGLVHRIVRFEESAAFEHLVDVGRRKALEAVSHLLLELCTRQHRGKISSDCSSKFPITQALLADALGLTAAHVNRVLRQLREDGLVSISNHSLTIHDVGRLSELCEFSKEYTAHMPVV